MDLAVDDLLLVDAFDDVARLQVHADRIAAVGDLVVEALDLGESGLEAVLLVRQSSIRPHRSQTQSARWTDPLRFELLAASGDGNGVFEYTFVAPEPELCQRWSSGEELCSRLVSLAERSTPKPTNFRVGAVLVDEPNNRILSTGYTLELAGNTHAEQCCFLKCAAQSDLPEDRVGEVLPEGTVLYTTMEPCNKRSVGNLPCVDRILRTKQSPNGGIRTVYLGVREPETFVGENLGRSKLEDSGIRCVHITGLEEEILKVATAGHEKREQR